MTAQSRALAVAAGLLQNAEGRWLVAQRPEGKADAGLWEFPGGKLKPGESAFRALARELREELGVEIEQGEALAVVRHVGARRIHLHGWVVRQWRGIAIAREHQALKWVAAPDLIQFPMPAPDGPLRARVALPRHYAITPDPDDRTDFASELRRTLTRSDLGIISLRARPRSSDAYARSAEQFLRTVRAERPDLLALIHGTPDEAQVLGFDGAHLSSAALAAAHSRSATPMWLFASVHNAREIALAESLGVDAMVLAPVGATETHPGAPTLGWQRFAALTRRTATPVYALGGLQPAQLGHAHAHGAFGLAAIRGYWDASVR